MGYHLIALISRQEALQPIVQTHPGTALALLDQNFAVFPLTDELLEELAYNEQVASSSFPESFNYLSRPITDLVVQASKVAATMYVEADFFGGVGQQAVSVWEAGEVIFGPLLLHNE